MNAIDAADDLRAPTDREFRLFQRFVYEHAGIHLPPTKRALLHGRLARRVRQLGLRTFAAYFDFVEQSEAEQVEFFDRITTNETAFFREPRHFNFIHENVVPSWMASRHGGTASVWSAGCATGEEPYSIAMLLSECLPREQWTIDILATDLSSAALVRAEAGEWPIARAGQIPQHLLREYMLKGVGPRAGTFKAGPELRSAIRFERANLNDETSLPPRKFDLIFCRNVLIYFDRDPKIKAIDRLIDRLAPGGHLFVGHAESLTSLTTRVRSVEPTIYTLAGEESL